MSIGNKIYFDLASLAEAAYALFRADVDSKRSLVDAGFSGSQASDLLSRWSLVDGGHNSGAGYSSTLFEGDDGFVLAFRGTAELTDDLISADILDIVSDGVAIHQIIDMANEWERITSSGGYRSAWLETLEFETIMLRKVGMAYLPILALRNDVIVDLPSNTVKTILWENSAIGGLGLGDEIVAKGLTVVGHSLGGHLAAAFTRLIPDIGTEAFTVNGAGFGVLGLNGFASKNVSNLFSMLFGNDQFDVASVLNVYGEKNPEFITQDALLQQPGASVPIFIEQPGVWDNKLGHSAIAMTDTLAVYDLFFKMDKSVSLDELLVIFNGASHKAETSLENIVSVLVKMFGAGDTNITTDDRESLHSHIDFIRKSNEFKSLNEKVTVITDVNSINAKNNFSHFISLYHLAPFVLEGAESALQKSNSDVYSLWNADSALTPKQRSEGKANFSDDWYQDRAAMLKALISRNEEDEATDTNTNDGEYDIIFTDEANSLSIVSEGKSSSKTSVVIFGDEKANEITGWMFDDHLYGMKGNDKLNGQKGNDVLFGGEGDDQLTGGEGSDVLYGGNGKDTYIFENNFGTDIIKDSDGNGTISITGWSGNFKSVQGSDIVFRDDGKKFEAIKVNNGSSTDLLITSLSEDTQGNILIKNWQEGHLGISLAVVPPTPADGNSRTVNGDSNANAISLDNLRDTDPNLDLSTISALKADGGVGNDIIMGMLNGSDTLLGGEGDDLISGGFTTTLDGNAVKNFHSGANTSGADSIDGGTGNDYIFAAAGGSIAHGGTGNDVLLSTGPAYFLFNKQRELRADSFYRIDGHIAITRDQVLKDVQPLLNFKLEEKADGWKANVGYFENFTNQLTEYDSQLGDFNFVGAKRTGSSSQHSDGEVSYGFTGDYVLEYGYRRNSQGELLLLDGGMGVDLSPATVVVSMFGPAAGRKLDDYATIKGANLFGDAGRDYLWGGMYADYLSGGTDQDTIFAGAGHDILDGGDGDDLLKGQEGNDILIGGSNDDTLDGGDGNDVLIGGDGKDQFFGGAGDDIIIASAKDKGINDKEGSNIFIIDDVVSEKPDLISFFRESTNFAFAAQNSLLTSNSSNANNPSLTIDAAGGNNTLALIGITSIDQLTVFSQDNNLFIEVGNASFGIVDGLNGAVSQIAFGESVDEFNNSMGSAAGIDINEVMLERLINSVEKVGTGAGQVIAGSRFDDKLTAHVGGSMLVGGKGNDSLIGGLGDDIYQVRLGDGDDLISESGGNNSISFAEGIDPSQVKLRRVNGGLLVLVNGEDSVTVSGMFDLVTGDVIASKAIQFLRFSSGEEWSTETILQKIIEGDLISGSQYADELVAYEGNDTLIGGKGNDLLEGNKGDDIYKFSVGDGADSIKDVAGSDEIHFDDVNLEAQVSLRKDIDNNLIVRINNSDSITIADAFLANGELSSSAIEKIQFGNSVVWDAQRIKTEVEKNLAYQFNGSAGDDQLRGDNAKSVLTGGQGNDALLGGRHDDTYRYTLGDGKDTITDINGIDRLELTGIDEANVISRRDGDDLVMTLQDGGVITVRNAFSAKAANVVDPAVLSIATQLQNRWLSQAEALIETHYGLTGSGDITLGFENGSVGDEAAHVEAAFDSPNSVGTDLKLVIDLSDFSNVPNGAAPWYYDRVIAHEMVHAVMARNMNTSQLPGWFVEGTAEFIHGADERVRGDAAILGLESNFNLLFKTTPGSPVGSPSYSVSYIAVKLLDKEIRNNGGQGIKDIFNYLKAGNSLDQALIAASGTYPGLLTQWNNLESFETHFRQVGFSQYTSLLNLNDNDTGSIAGSDYSNAPKGAAAIIPEGNTGPSKNFNLIIPDEYIPTPEVKGGVESITFSNGAQWDLARINQEVLKPTLGNDSIHAFNTNDILTGSKGDDHLYGYAGNDTYYYSLGDGNDVIVDSAGTDKIEFGADILATEIVLMRDSSNNLVITLKDNSTVTVRDAFNSAGELSSQSIETIKFANGDEWNSEIILQEVNRVGPIIQGTDGDEVLHGRDGTDYLVGGLGNDSLYGYAGNDTYHYSLGDGNDVIVDSAGTDKIEFGANILSSEIALTRDSSNNLVVRLKDNSTVTVRDAFNSAGELSSQSIEAIKFANGDEWNSQVILQEANRVRTNIVQGTDDDDVLYGRDDKDHLIGGLGNDSLYGGKGDDVYYYRNGDGNDQINDDSGVDEIAFGEGILPQDISLYRQGWFGLKVVLKDGSIILINNMFNSSDDTGTNAIEGIRFSTDEFWNLEKIKAQVIQDSATEGNDIVQGFASGDVIEGGGGFDQLRGKGGDDRYIFNRGDGVDVITDTGGNDTLVFGPGIAPTDVVVHQSNGNFYFIINNGEMVQVTGSVVNGVPAEATLLERVEFSGGVIWDKTIIQQKINETLTNPNLLMGNSSWDHLQAGNNNSVVNGLDDYDQIYGGNGNDTLIGGGGLNFLDGGAGDDTYLITEQPAINFIEKFRDGFDRILFAEGITPEDVTVKLIPGRQESHLENGVLWVYSFSQANDWNFEIKVGDTTVYLDSLLTSGALFGAKIKDPLLPTGKVEFFNGTQWTVNDLLQQAVKGTTADDYTLGSGNNDVINGLAGNDLIYALDGADVIDGGEGDDTLIGGYGKDILIGGKGNDLLRGDNSSREYSNLYESIDDVYRFNRGDGNDTIEEYFGRDIIEFGAGITKEQVVLSTVGNDTVVSFLDSTDTITIKYGALPETEFYSGGKIEIFKFANGDEWNFDPRTVQVISEGGEGSDTLTGGYGNDTFIGHAGNDYLRGDLGDDTYHYNLGDGFDDITDVGGFDRIVLGDSITPDMVKVRNTWNQALMVSIAGIDVFSFNNGISHTNSDFVLEQLIFSSSNVVWDQATIFSKSLQSTSGNDEIYGSLNSELVDGGAGNDRIETYAGADTLVGGLGNDYLRGGQGDDIYRFSPGDGSDSVEDNGGQDTIEFLAGILPTDISVQHEGADLIIKVKNANPITLKYFFNSDTNRAVNELSAIESIIFANGETWSLAQLIAKLSTVGTSTANTLYGLNSAEIIDGREGNDTIYAGGGNDTLIGGVGNDRLYGEVGDDLLQGGDGDDQLQDYFGNNIFEGGKGTDYILADSTFDSAEVAIVRYNLGDGVDYIDPAKFNRIEFGAGITPDMLFFKSHGVLPSYSTYEHRNGFDIYFKGSTDKLIGLIDSDQFEIVFSNNYVLKGADLSAHVNKSIVHLSADRKSITGKTEPGLKLLVSYRNQDNTITYYPELTADAQGNYTFNFGFGIKDHSRITVIGTDTNFVKLPLIAVPPAQDTSIPPSPVVELDLSGYVITGFARPGAYISVSTPDRHVGAVHSDLITGAFTIVAPSRLNNGEQISVVASGDGVAQSAPTIISAPHSATPPDVLAPVLPTGKFNSTGKIVSGTAEAGTLVVIQKYYPGGIPGVIGYTRADQNNSWSVELAESIIDGSVVNAISVDAGNNRSSTSITSPDLTIPLPASAQFDSTGKYISGGAEFTAAGGDQIIVMDSTNTVVLGSAVLSPYVGSYQITLATALKNNEVVNVIVKDVAGNTSTVTRINAPDSTRPEAPSATIDLQGKVVSGSAEPGAVVEVKKSGTLLGKATADAATGAYSITLGTALINRETLNVTATDAAGNVSVPRLLDAPGVATPNPTSVTIQAENYTSMSGVQKESTNDVGGGQVASYIDTGDWMAYNNAAFNVPAEGRYKITYRVASLNGGGRLTLKELSNDSALGSVTIPKTSGWQNWVDVTQEITLGSGVHNFKLAVDIGGFNINWFKLEPVVADTTPPITPTAAFDTQRKIISGAAEPGSVVVVKNANNTNTLGSVTAHATTGAYSITLATALASSEAVNVTATDAAGNVSTPLLVPGVATPNPAAVTIQAENYTSMSGVQKESTNDVGGGQVASYIDTGDWMAYNNAAFNVPAEGRYKITYRVSSLNGGGRLTLKELSNDSALGSVTIPKTSSWQNWVDVTQEITLGSGVHNFKLAVDIGGFNINWFKLEPVVTDITPPVQPTAAFDTQGKVISGVAEAGSVVVVKNSSNTNTLGTVTAHATTGAYSIMLVTALTNQETVNVTATDAAGNVSIARALVAPGVATPNPAAVTIQAENYTSMSGVQKESTSDVGGGQSAGYIDTGDWMAYNNAAFNVPAEGRYKITYRVASLNGGGRLTLKELSNDSALGSVTIPKTSGWQNWVDVTQEITLGSGVHNFKLAVDIGGFNINWFKLEPVAPVSSATATLTRLTSGLEPQSKTIADIVAEGGNLNADSESFHYYRSNDALIQAMASFEPAQGVQSNYRFDKTDTQPFALAVSY